MRVRKADVRVTGPANRLAAGNVRNGTDDVQNRVDSFVP